VLQKLSFSPNNADKLMMQFSKGSLYSLLSCLALFCAAPLAAQVIVGPDTDTKIAACEGIGSLLLQNPIDFSEGICTDVANNFLGVDVSGLSGISCADGTFSATTTATGSTFYFFSPVACGAYPAGGRYGQKLNIDVSKYRTLVFRLYSSSADSLGYRLIWDRSCNYANVRSITSPSPVSEGWNSYTMNLSSASLDAGSNTSPWSSGSITGFAMLPTVVNGANIKLDYLDIVDQDSCGTTSISYSATTSGSDRRVSLFLDDDGNPFNGFHKQLLTAAAASGASTANVSALALPQANLGVVGLLHSDYFTLLGKPFDMSSSAQILASSGVSGLSVTGGSASGTTDSTGTNLYLRIPGGGFSASTYSSFSMRLTPAGGNHRIYWFNSNGGSSFKDLSSYHLGSGLYQIDLDGESQWTANITDFVIRPAQSAGVAFSLDFVTFADNAFYSSLDTTILAASAAQSSGDVVVNTIPTGQFMKPGEDGGKHVAAWDMNPGDLVTFSNLSSANDSTYTAEKLSCWLPDVREVDGVRGDFWKSTSLAGNDDPVQYLTFPGASSLTISASEYYHLCVKQYTDTNFSLGLGAVGRVIWRTSDTDYKTSEDLPLIFNSWLSSDSTKGWTEFCMNMNDVPVEGGAAGAWTGSIDGLRFDPHEYSTATTTYTDYITLAADPVSPGVYTISIAFSDSDDDASATLYYSSSAATSGGTLITTLNENTHSYYKWDTTGLASGTYYLYAVLSDGTNENTIRGKTPVVVTNSATFGSAPVLNLQTPSGNMAVCNTLQVKGYALQADRLEKVSAVKVSVNGDLLGTIYPSDYSSAAALAYPNQLSSNSGFNQSYNISAYSNGPLSVTIVAVSSDGEETTSSIAVTKQASDCPSTISDASPSGVAIAESALDTAAMEKPALSIKIKGKVVTFKVANAGTNADECIVTIAGRNKKGGSVVASKAVTMAASNNLTLKSKAGASAFKLFHTVTRTCRGNAVNGKVRTTGFKAVTGKTTKTANKYLKSLYAKLK
jgi:hypothetical protein